MNKILIAEDDMVSRKFLSKVLSEYGECDIVVDGLEAVEAFMMSSKENEPYDLICLDIMMPKVDGIKVLKVIRDLETQNNIPEEKRSKIIMTTALGETEIVKQAMEYECDAYASKPINIDKLVQVMKKLGLIDG
jgi:two-component system chemotaxis response regulator CheY